jgi:peptidoglycan-N-acetylglucosamine deacetylase
VSGVRLAAISVDLDEIPCYAAIHGLPPPHGAAARAIYEKALARHVRLFADEKIPATFFAIGSDIDDANASRIRSLARAGHEIGNHTLDHHYGFTRLPRSEIRAQIAGGMEVIANAIGERPSGFRAPGYTITDEVFEVLEDLGVGYDSSVFPCPAYYAAKTAAIFGIRARGRRSHSIVDDPRVLRAPADPYRVGRPYWRRGKGLVELPIGVSRGPRLPYIGTYVVFPSEHTARALTRSVVGRPLVNLEIHGIDLSDAAEDDLGFLVPHQFDLRRRARDKEAALRAAISVLRDAGYRFVTLREAAERCA